MKNRLIISVLGLCFAAACQFSANANEQADKAGCRYNGPEETEWFNGEFVLKSTKQPVNGIVCAYHDNGNVSDSKIEGTVRRYYESGKLEFEIPINNLHKTEGISKGYYENGNLKLPIKTAKKKGLKNNTMKAEI